VKSTEALLRQQDDASKQMQRQVEELEGQLADARGDAAVGRRRLLGQLQASNAALIAARKHGEQTEATLRQQLNEAKASLAAAL